MILVHFSVPIQFPYIIDHCSCFSSSDAGGVQASYSPSLTTQASTDSSKPSFFGFDSQVPFAYPPSHLPPVKRSRTPDHVLTSYTDQYVYKTTSPPVNTKSRSVLLSSQRYSTQFTSLLSLYITVSAKY